MDTRTKHIADKYFCMINICTVLCLIMAGGYYEICDAMVGCILCFLFFWYSFQTKISLYINDSFLAVIFISISYVISCLWAVDTSSAVWGIAKLFPVFMYALCVMQLSKENRRKLILNLPYMAIVVVLLSFLLQFIPVVRSQIIVNGRLGGIFGYPNTFGLFLLICLWISFWMENKYVPVIQGIIMTGIALTGSRSVIALTVITIMFIVSHRIYNKKNALWLLIVMVLSIICSLALNQLIGMNLVDHVAGTASQGGASTFWGRILYYKDAIPVIVQHPFGLGYLGYYFTQGNFQHGVYSVRWVHNDLLQILLDVGWIPAIFLIVAVVRSFLSKEKDILEKGMLILLVIHGMFDFNMEFTVIWFVLILCLDLSVGKEKKLAIGNMSRVITVGFGCLISMFSLYVGVVSSLVYLKKYDMACTICPWNTFVLINKLTETENAENMQVYADKIIGHNEYIAIAWDAKARVAYSNGDFDDVIQYKEKAIESNRYSIDEYIDYFDMLKSGYIAYAQVGDGDSAQVCYDKAAGIQTQLDTLSSTSDNLAWKLNDTPELEMSEDYKQFILQGGSK